MISAARENSLSRLLLAATGAQDLGWSHCVSVSVVARVEVCSCARGRSMAQLRWTQVVESLSGSGRRRRPNGQRVTCVDRPFSRTSPQASSKKHAYRNSSPTNTALAILSTLPNGGQRSQRRLSMGCPYCDRFLTGIRIHLRCEGWHSSCHLRPSPGCF